MQSLDFGSLDFFDERERPMEIVELIMSKQNLNAKLVDIILRYLSVSKIDVPSINGRGTTLEVVTSKVTQIHISQPCSFLTFVFLKVSP